MDDGACVYDDSDGGGKPSSSITVVAERVRCEERFVTPSDSSEKPVPSTEDRLSSPQRQVAERTTAVSNSCRTCRSSAVGRSASQMSCCATSVVKAVSLPSLPSVRRHEGSVRLRGMKKCRPCISTCVSGSVADILFSFFDLRTKEKNVKTKKKKNSSNNEDKEKKKT